MQRPMNLRCKVSVSQETPSMYHICTAQFDGTPVNFKTSMHNVELSLPLTEEQPWVIGWVQVVQEAKQGARVAITLPSPTIEFGRNISVHEDQLMPLGVTIDHFRSTKCV